MEKATELEVFNERKLENQNSTFGTANEFDEVFATAVYETLSWTSSFVAPVLHIYLHDAMTFEFGQRKSRLGIQDAKNLEKGLEKIFGFGAKIVEYRILGTLYSRLGLKEEIEQGFKFSGEVEKARKLFESRPRVKRHSVKERRT